MYLLVCFSYLLRTFIELRGKLEKFIAGAKKDDLDFNQVPRPRGTSVEMSKCGKCGQLIVRWPHEDDWNHHGNVDWALTDQMGCFCIATPATGEVHANIES